MINTESIRRLPSSVWAINFGDGKNAINPEFLTNLENELDLVEAESRVEGGPRALITYSTGRFYCNGLDLDFMKSQGPSVTQETVKRFHSLLARILSFHIPTVAVVSGHAAAGGYLIALAHDYIVHIDGLIVLSEIDAGVPFTPGTMALVKAKLGPKAQMQAALNAQRYTRDTSSEEGLSTRSGDLQDAINLAKELAEKAKKRDAYLYHQMKEEMYRDTLATLREGVISRGTMSTFRSAVMSSKL